jgi:uroporphyrinogen III methyltransferase/synthase
VPQDVTTALLLEKAQAGLQVVRLKGGDPFVFGRGGEEAQACVAAGIPFEVVPAVTSGIAAPAYAGIPVTQRGITSAVAFVTGHEDPDKPETLDRLAGARALPRDPVLLHGRAHARAHRRAARGRRRPAGEPVAVVMRGTYGDQRSVRGTLADIAQVVRDAGIGAPAITVVGGVAALHDELGWLREARPLGGRTVAVTRARAQASGIAATLGSLGATVVEAPAIRIEPLGPSCRRSSTTTSSSSPRSTRCSSSSPTCATRASSRARPSPPSARARSPSCAATGSPPTSSRSARSPRRSSRS